MYYLGLDFGTSGARAIIIDDAEQLIWSTQTTYHTADSPHSWRDALFELIAAIPAPLRAGLTRIAIDGTSGTVLLTDDSFEPITPVLMYNHPLAGQPAAKLTLLTKNTANARYLMHQVDYLNAQLTSVAGISDYHNALKSGYDVRALKWQAELCTPEFARLLPTIVAPGTPIAKLQRRIARHYNLNANCTVHTGTTDSIAAFIAAGATHIGMAVTSLGSTLVLKLLSQHYVASPKHGVYSHKFGNLWLVGGASNTGGAVLRQFFTDDELITYSALIDPSQPALYDYYPLPSPGERFPVCDPNYQPRLTPRPDDNIVFLHELLAGMARIEQQGYAKLVELGADDVTQVLTAGGGSKNPQWQAIRARFLNIPVNSALCSDAAFGSALMAKRQEL
ncbi:FGGY-family carbohydrate kinase [Sulfuriferula nivalis]|uniref:Sugar kinase n=1 Tax=Sulfuriferula nivalis TaxID=2675298 RepID=A0A809S9L9_9PROT|nr:FGGY-family carbohydrate kinase [Sulfuriferula nivalis]BBP01022.1 sugar kinase [Sulfuriferula nivalis]